MRTLREREAAGLEKLCGLFGCTRQAFYKHKEADFTASAMETLIVEEVGKIRETAPGIGSSTLYPLLLGVFGRENMPGRDAFYLMVKANGLQLKRRRSYRTTNSMHRYHKWKNLTKDFTATAPNRLWVSDITYIKTLSGVVYLHLVSDAYSRKVLGWKVSDSLEARHTLEAFNMAAADAARCGVDFTQLIHHSDRGVQYCCDMYVERLTALGIRISMTERHNPTDNATAERINGILKQLFIEGQTMAEISDVYYAMRRGIAFYNDIRPHSSISHEPPSRVHSGLVSDPHRMWTPRHPSRFNTGNMEAANAQEGAAGMPP